MLQKSYSEGVGAGFPLTQNIRYQLAKTKVDDLFIKWLTQSQTQKCKRFQTKQSNCQPNAFFTNKMIISGLSQSALLNSPNIKSQKPSIPTKIDSIYNLKLKIPEDLSQSLTQSQIFFKKCHVEETQNYDLDLFSNLRNQFVFKILIKCIFHVFIQKNHQ